MFSPFSMLHGPMAHRLNLRKVKVSGNEIVQYLQFVRGDIVLCDSNILRRGKITGKCGEPHKWLFGIGLLKNHLCGGMALGGIVCSLFCTILKKATDSALLGS